MESINKTYNFCTNTVGYEIVQEKSGKKHYITGYISTKDKDLLNDVVTDEALSGMLKQLHLKSIKLDVEHEAWRENNPSILPIGKIVEAHKDDKGIFVKAVINTDHNRFKEVWGSIKNGFLDAFSIAYKAKDYTYKLIDGVKTRILDGIELLNIALTGNPVNPEATMTNVFMKSLNNYKEENRMTEENDKPLDKVKEEPKVKVEEKPEEEVKETTEDVKKDESETEEKVEEKSEEITELKSIIDSKDKEMKSMKEKLDELDAEVKDLKKELKEPIMKADVKDFDVEKKNMGGNKIKLRGPLDTI